MGIYIDSGFSGIKIRKGSHRYVAFIHLSKKKHGVSKNVIKTFDSLYDAIDWRNEIKGVSTQVQPVCTQYCKDCLYCNTLNKRSTILVCEYILHKHKRRPCLAGDNCTVKEKMPKGYKEARRRDYGESFVTTWSQSKKSKVFKERKKKFECLTN